MWPGVPTISSRRTGPRLFDLDELKAHLANEAQGLTCLPRQSAFRIFSLHGSSFLRCDGSLQDQDGNAKCAKRGSVDYPAGIEDLLGRGVDLFRHGKQSAQGLGQLVHVDQKDDVFEARHAA